MAHWKDAAVTDAGVEMQNEWMAGRFIKITAAYGGTGTVDPEELVNQTELVDQRQELQLLGEENGLEGKTVRVQVSNVGVMEEYELNQVGVYAKLDPDRDPEAEERLLFIMQDEKGVAIPSSFDASFLLELYCMIGITNTGRFDVSISAAGVVTAAYMREVLEKIMLEHNADEEAHPNIRESLASITTGSASIETTVADVDARLVLGYSLLRPPAGGCGPRTPTTRATRGTSTPMAITAAATVPTRMGSGPL